MCVCIFFSKEASFCGVFFFSWKNNNKRKKTHLLVIATGEMRLTYMREVRKKGQKETKRRERRERERNNNGRWYGRQFILRGDPDV